ncbi:four-helix bundle copper-binding protein (plasmid) [Rubrobacter marinus]|uniref:Four-helix bundle copper-binding protein n=1 Tax=Rubrobacter marinus TaxID=2653852 RepID=A0A6G8Q3B8_9ACTN|nr:four-helix bundle copper-binding protein [Rubrobacter marinus]QIN80994.1 four-helix bundle copper-binding protein [Rubrobacter marinus]
MTHAQQMVQTNPSQPVVEQATLVECIEACFDCAQACTACADACLGEGDVQMLARCIRLDLDCADVCDATGKILSRQTATEPAMIRATLQACAEACRLCGDECENHAQHGMQHCQACADACRRCESACKGVLSGIAA